MAAKNQALQHDPSAATDHHRPDDRFIPIRVTDLIQVLAEDVATFGPNCAAFRDFAEALRDLHEQEAGEFERRLADRFAAFNPDRDTLLMDAPERLRTPEALTALHARLDYLLEKANFQPLTDLEVEDALRAADSSGLRVRLDPSQVDHLGVWIRGQGEVVRSRRLWHRPWRDEVRRLHVYRRLAVVIRLRGDPYVRLKLFKEIPIADVEALLPHAQVQMSWFDRLKLMGGAGGLFSTGWKIVAGGMALAQLAWLLFVAFGMVSVRVFTGYRNIRAHRDLQRTTNLYYQNLSNNAGAIHLLVALVSQEEIKEGLLAYAFLCGSQSPPESAEALRERVERYFRQRFRLAFQFDVGDALETLDYLGLWTDRGAWRLIPPEEAVARLRDHWCARRSLDYHECMLAQRLASGAQTPPESEQQSLAAAEQIEPARLPGAAGGESGKDANTQQG